jgi:catechol 2,3-dioxygenase-like lactoylglutathione lyase family enzyme
MNITGSNVTIMVADMDRAINFYSQIGLLLKQRWDNHYAMMEAPGITIGLHPAEGNNNSSGSLSVGLFIDDLDAAKALLEKHGIAYKDEDGSSGHYLHFKDPDNTIVYFVLPKWQ